MCFVLLILVTLTAAACRGPATPAAATAEAATPLPPPTATSEPAPSPTIQPTATQTHIPEPTVTPEPTNTVFVEPEWTGEWDVYLSSPTLSIVKTVRFQVIPATGAVAAQWDEGTRTVYFEGVLSEDGRSVTGTFWNTDAESYTFTIAFLPNGTQFSGPLTAGDVTGAFCGARSGLGRPRPCGELP
jgi:hypothetical protein